LAVRHQLLPPSPDEVGGLALLAVWMGLMALGFGLLLLGVALEVRVLGQPRPADQPLVIELRLRCARRASDARQLQGCSIAHAPRIGWIDVDELGGDEPVGEADAARCYALSLQRSGCPGPFMRPSTTPFCHSLKWVGSVA
jgi:hypothetical protein